MCLPIKAKTSVHPLLDNTLFNSLNIKCTITLTHDVMGSEDPYIICAKCYKPRIYNKVLTQYLHAFHFGNVPKIACRICGGKCYQNKPLIECSTCTRAYYQFLQHVSGEEENCKRLVALIVNSQTLRIEYSVPEANLDLETRDDLVNRIESL